MITDNQNIPINTHLKPFDPHSLNISYGENLPHWQCNEAIYHISFRLADSVPETVLKHWMRERDFLLANAKQLGKSEEEAERRAQYLYSEKIEKYLDAGYGKCYLRNPEIAKIVANSILYFNNARYHIHAWCIMPNHVHVIANIIPGYDFSKIFHSWKSFTAHSANKLLGLSGSFWQRDAYNHIIRSKREYRFQIYYTWENPEKAGLQNWPWRWKIEDI